MAVSGSALGVAAVAPSTTTTAVGGADAVKSKSKSRSRSRKRGSIFGALLGEKKESKKEEKVEKEGDKAVKPDILTEGSAETSKPVEPASLDAAAVGMSCRYLWRVFVSNAPFQHLASFLPRLSPLMILQLLLPKRPTLSFRKRQLNLKL